MIEKVDESKMTGREENGKLESVAPGDKKKRVCRGGAGSEGKG